MLEEMGLSEKLESNRCLYKKWAGLILLAKIIKISYNSIIN